MCVLFQMPLQAGCRERQGPEHQLPMQRVQEQLERGRLAKFLVPPVNDASHVLLVATGDMPCHFRVAPSVLRVGEHLLG